MILVVSVSMLRKSRWMSSAAISRSAPAISTPVGPPPTTTNVSFARRVASSCSSSASSNASSTRRRISVASSRSFSPGASCATVVLAEVGVRHADADGEVIEVDADVAAADLPVREVDPVDRAERDADVLLRPEDPPDRVRDVRRREGGRRDLVQERLEQVVVVTVDQDDVDRAVLQPLGEVDPCKAGPDDHQPFAGGGRSHGEEWYARPARGNAKRLRGLVRRLVPTHRPA